MTALSLVPLIVVIPLAIAAAMLASAHFLPARCPDAIAALTSLAVAILCALLVVHTARHGNLVYWFGGWTPRPGVVLGIGFGVDPISAGIAAFVGFLFFASFIFAWGYFDEVHAHFQVIMLLFLAAMVGFCLTRDLFNLFVWFEVMSVAAFALTAYQLEAPSLEGALNFTITNSLASFLMLGGVGLIYGRAGALDFTALGHAVDHGIRDPVITGAFCLLAAALMIKAAILPFHFWLSDAHAVAPSPVSVIFSGAMVALGLFALAKLGFQVFHASVGAQLLLHGLFKYLGGATAVVGGLMAWSQRHLKRMLAFSTIAHLGIMLIGLTALSATGLAGLTLYIVGHGLVKGGLFMVVGILLSLRASVDELALKGQGQGLWPVGAAMMIGGLLLSGLPWGALDAGTQLVHAANDSFWIEGTIFVGMMLTGAAVLRAAGRIFLDLGTGSAEEANSPSQDEEEKPDRPLWLMLAPCVLLLVLALMPVHGVEPFLARATALFAGRDLGPPATASATYFGATAMALALLLAALDLFRQRLADGLLVLAHVAFSPLFKALRILHSGLVGDYVLWIVAGLAAFSLALGL